MVIGWWGGGVGGGRWRWRWGDKREKRKERGGGAEKPTRRREKLPAASSALATIRKIYASRVFSGMMSSLPLLSCLLSLLRPSSTDGPAWSKQERIISNQKIILNS